MYCVCTCTELTLAYVRLLNYMMAKFTGLALEYSALFGVNATISVDFILLNCWYFKYMQCYLVMLYMYHQKTVL